MIVLDINSEKVLNVGRRQGKKIWFAGILIGLLFAFGPCHVAAQTPKGDGAGLFADLPLKAASGLAAVDESLVVRRRPCGINFGMLVLERGDKPERLLLNLSDDKTFTALLDRIETGFGSGHAWIGHLEGIEGSAVTLVFEDDRLSGTIIFPGGHFEVRHVVDGIHEIREIAPDLMADTLRAVACTNLTSRESQSITLVNQERATHSLHLYSCDQRLVTSSRAHSTDMATNNFFDHTGTGGTSAGDRMTSAGYVWNAWGENIAKGYSTAQAVHNAWMNSPGHRANILNSTFCDIGVGYAYGAGHYWTQNFGRLQGVTACSVAPPPVCPDCSGSTVTLNNVTFPSGAVCNCVATVSITLGTGVTIPSGATVTFQAPTVTMKDGFHAENGSTVTIKQ